MTTVCAAGNGAHLKLVDGSPAHLNRGAELEEAGRFVSVVEGAAACGLSLRGRVGSTEAALPAVR